jgi:putative oxidoreductase
MSVEALARTESRIAAISQAGEAGAAGCVVLAGRALFVAIFLMAAPGHFTQQTIGYAAHQGVPMAGFLVPASGVLSLIGGLSILTGYRARIGAWLLVLFLIPVTITMHNFWAIKDPVMAQMHMAMFMKNLSMLGGALLISHFGAGPMSLDARAAARSARTRAR